MQKGARIGAGRTAEIFAWGETEILKLFRQGYAGEAAAHEAALAAAIQAAGAPCPTVGGLLEVEGRFGVIYERIDGPSLEAQIRARPWRFAPIAALFAETQAAAQSCVVPTLPSLRQELARRIERAAPLSADLRAAALQALEHLPDGSALCHMDFHLGNVLLSRRGPVVIDWENATCGHPLADVTRTLLLLQMGRVYPKSAIQRAAVRGVSAAFRAVYLRRYRQFRPASRAQITAWQLPVAAARLSEGITEEEPHLLALVARLAESN